MLASPRSSRKARRGLGPALLAATLGALLGAGCATVSPAEKEYLADPGMTFGSEGRPGAHADHVYSNREGSFGARGVGGGGCGCN